MTSIQWKSALRTEGSVWFRRFLKDCKRISRHIRIKRIKYGFFRIYWKHAYIGEVYKEMPPMGYDFEEKNMHFDEKKYYEKLEDRAELTRRIKNFKEGYYDSLDRIRTKAWLMKHDKEFYDTATKGYQTIRVK